MKRKIFDLLMEIKAEVLKSLKPPEAEIVSSEIQVSPGSEMPIVDDVVFATLEEDEPKAISFDGKTKSITPETRYFQIQDAEHSRKIAYTVSGDMDADNLLLCLPGLLETKASFLVIHAYFLKFDNCKVISIDFSGRGETDYIDNRGGYKMSLYLSDISQLVRGTILVDRKIPQKLTVLGTSMGGVLAMYLTQIFGKRIYGIILNDIALTVNWTSLYALYKSMKNDLGFKGVRDLAKDLSVDEKAISDVQLPGHFDLSYQADVWGMNFHEALEGYKGHVGLIYGSKSKICTKQRVAEAGTFIPHIKTLEVANAGHPAPFNLAVCDFIETEMGV